MSFITVGYTDRINSRNQVKPPGGSQMSDIFSHEERTPVNGKTVNKTEDTSISKTNETLEKNGQRETTICEKVEALSVEQNSNDISTVTKTESTSTHSVEVTVTNSSGVNANKESLNGNDEHISKTSTKSVSKSAVNNIIPADVKDCASTPQRRNRVPPGGYSSGLW